MTFTHGTYPWQVQSRANYAAGPQMWTMLPSGAVLNLTETLFHTARDTEVEGATSLRRVPMDLHAVLPSPGVAMSLHVAPPVDGGPIPISVHELAARLGIRDAEGRAVEFVHVIWEILRRGVVLSDNRRLPFRRSFTPGDLDRPLSLRDGSNIPLELCRLKNGDIDQRRRYGEIEDTFAQLTGRRLGLRARSAPAHVSTDGLIIEPTVVTDRGELPVEFAGAGVQEALVWSTLLPGDPGRIIVLDEPAVNLEPTVQRRLIGTLRDSGQCLVITHSPDLVPIDRPEDLANVVRLAPTNNGPLLRRAEINNRKEWVRRVKLMEDIHVRALLFAAKVILCEGSTEVGALRRWWSNAACVDLPDPEAANIAVIGVGGDNSFGAYVEYLDAFGLPWAIVTDGPALRPTSSLARQLRRLAHLPAEMPDPDDDFERWRTSWQSAGVFSLADEFGDDGTKGGEFEEFLARVDPTLLATVQSEIGTTSKPRVGALFATKHPTPPPEVLNLYRLIMQWFGYDIGPRQFTGPSPSRRTPTSGAAHHHLP